MPPFLAVKLSRRAIWSAESRDYLMSLDGAYVSVVKHVGDCCMSYNYVEYNYVTLLVGEKLCRVITLLVGEKLFRVIKSN